MNRPTPQALLMDGVSPATGLRVCACCNEPQDEEQFDLIAYLDKFVKLARDHFRGMVCMDCMDNLYNCDGCNDPVLRDEMIEQANGDFLCTECNGTPCASASDLLADYHRSVL